MATVFIIDDDASIRKSLSRLLRAEEIKTETFESAISYLEREEYVGIGCILLDVDMPKISGIELQKQLIELGSELPIVFLTGHGDIPMGVLATKRGAIDFLTKPVDESDLLRAVRQALDYHSYILNDSLARRAIRNRMDALTPREQEVVRELITGAPNKVIADRLQIAVKTVKVHRSHVMEKMGVRSVAELLQLCHLVGIEPDTDTTP